MSSEKSIICQYMTCKNLYDKPVVLICCGESICQRHVEDLCIDSSKSIIKCCFCQEEMKIPKKGLPVNRGMEKMLSVDLGPIHKLAKDTLDNFELNIREYEDLINNPGNYITEHFENVRKQVDSSRIEWKTIIDNFYDRFMTKINNLEADCMNNRAKLQDIDLKNFRIEYEKWNGEIRKFIIDESRWKRISNDIREELDEIGIKIKEIQAELLNNKIYEFKKTVKEINNEDFFGKIVIKGEFIEKKYDLLSCSVDKNIKMWQIDTGECLQAITGHSHFVYCIKLLTNDKLISCSDDKTIKVWNVWSGECLKTFECDTDPFNYPYKLLKIKNDEFLSGHRNGEIKHWNINQDEPIRIFYGHTHLIIGLDLMLDKNQLISCAYNKSIKVWDLDTGECVKSIQIKNFGFINNIKLLSGFNELYACTETGRVIKCDLNKLNYEELFRVHGIAINRIEILADYKLVTGAWDGTIKIWDLNTNSCVSTLNGHTNWIASFKLLSTDKLISCSGDQTIKIWDLYSLECIKTISGHIGPINEIELVERNKDL